MCQCHRLFVWLYTTMLPTEQAQPGAFPTKQRKYLKSAFCQLKSSLRDWIHSVKSIRRQLTLNGNITYLFKDFSLVSLVGTELCMFKFIYRQKKKSCLVNICNCISGEWFLKLNTLSAPKWWWSYYEHGNKKSQNFECNHVHDSILYVLNFCDALFQISRICWHFCSVKSYSLCDDAS